MKPAAALLAALCLCGAPGLATATQGYIGLGFGNAIPTVDKKSVKFDTQDYSPNTVLWRVFGGYQVSKNVGMETGYVSLGKPKVTDQNGDYYEAKVAGFEFTPVGVLPVVKDLSVFARAGAIFWSSDISSSFGVLGAAMGQKSGTSLSLSLGVRYDFIKRLGVRAEFTRYAIDKAKAGAGDFNVISLNAVFAF